jgi:hypothetical protein
MVQEAAQVKVRIAVAVCENGAVTTHIADSNLFTEQKSYKKWLEEIRTSKALWSVKIITTNVPYPIQQEDQTK